MPLRTEIRGINEARQSMENIAEALQGKEFMDAMWEAVNIVTADAKRFAPVDTGRLRASIAGQVSKTSFPMKRIQGIIGTNVDYAAFMEFGTGVFAGNPPVRMPPPEALEGWARRHKMNARVVAYAIYRRGGLEARKYFLRSMQKNEVRVVEILGNKVRMIIERS